MHIQEFVSCVVTAVMFFIAALVAAIRAQGYYYSPGAVISASVSVDSIKY